MSSQVQLDFNLFEFVITPRRSRWEWTVRDRNGKALMQGREKSRAAARYQSGRALFLLLRSSCRCCEARR